MRFVILAIILVLLAGFFHIMFIMYDNFYYNDDTGLFNVLPEKLNSSLNEDTRNDSWNRTQMLRSAFGLGRVICIVMVPVCIVLQAIDRPRIEG